MDISIISLIVASITAVGSIILSLHIKKCHSLCCDSECSQKNSIPPTPIKSNIDEISV
jgi:hypothetical protein